MEHRRPRLCPVDESLVAVKALISEQVEQPLSLFTIKKLTENERVEQALRPHRHKPTDVHGVGGAGLQTFSLEEAPADGWVERALRPAVRMRRNRLYPVWQWVSI